MEYRYYVRKGKKWETWTGSFFYKEMARKWLNKYGNFWKAKGYKLKLYVHKEPDLSEIINDILE